MARTLTAAARTLVLVPLFFLYTMMRAAQVIVIGKRSTDSSKIEAVIQRWSTLFLRIPPIVISVEGADHVDPQQRYVVVANHISNFDIPVLFRSVPTPIRFLAKKELYKIPLLGPGMDAAGIVKVDRSGARSAREAISTAARETYRRGYSLMVFAEGTRSRTGDMAEFHKGAARLALDNGANLLPVVVEGTFDVNPPGSMFIYPGRVRVKILDPIETEGYTTGDITGLTTELRERMNAVYEEMRGGTA
jgi:1-acyl-sn-glycerol-3-phosphate acyltransferase